MSADTVDQVIADIQAAAERTGLYYCSDKGLRLLTLDYLKRIRAMYRDIEAGKRPPGSFAAPGAGATALPEPEES